MKLIAEATMFKKIKIKAQLLQCKKKKIVIHKMLKVWY